MEKSNVTIEDIYFLLKNEKNKNGILLGIHLANQHLSSFQKILLRLKLKPMGDFSKSYNEYDITDIEYGEWIWSGERVGQIFCFLPNQDEIETYL